MDKRTDSAGKRARVECADCVACVAAKAAMENIRDELLQKDAQKLAEIRTIMESMGARFESAQQTNMDWRIQLRNAMSKLETRMMEMTAELDRLRGALAQALAE